MNSLLGNGRGSLFGWDPLRVFDDLMSWEPAGSQVVWSAYEPAVRITNHDDGSTITVDMPGVAPDDLELTFQEGQLAIRGRRGERVYAYRVELGDAIDPDRIEADLDKGVLTVQAHKKPEAKPRKISIKAGRSQNQLGDGESK